MHWMNPGISWRRFNLAEYIFSCLYIQHYYVEDAMRSNAFAKSLMDKDMNSFWRGITKVNNAKKTFSIYG